MAFTVTAAAAGPTPKNGIYLKVLVLTGATEAGGASASLTGSSPIAATTTITPSANNSLLAWAVSVFFVSGPNTYTAALNNTLYDQGSDAANSLGYGHGHYSGTVIAGFSATTIGASSSVSQTSQEIAGYEIRTPGVSTPAVDASTPAVAGNASGSSVTTASFTPPAPSVLVALVASKGAGSQVTSYSLSDTSGLGLTWTQRVFISSNSAAGVYTTTVPAPPPPVLYQMRSFP